MADDTVLVSNSITSLANILDLVIHFCKKYKVTLSASKTKLIRLCPDIKKVMKRVGGMRSCLVSNNSLLKSRDCGWILVALEMAPYIKSAFAFELLTKEQ